MVKVSGDGLLKACKPGKTDPSTFFATLAWPGGSLDLRLTPQQAAGLTVGRPVHLEGSAFSNRFGVELDLTHIGHEPPRPAPNK